MNEIRKKHIIQLSSANVSDVSGIVADFSDDRIKIKVDLNSFFEAKKIKELDELFVVANTHLGVKTMKAHVISCVDENGIIVIENNEALPVEQKREFVRVVSNFVFQINISDSEVATAYCNNISGGGIAFNCIDKEFCIDDILSFKFFENEFEKDFECKAQILKANFGVYSAKFINLKPFDEDRIVKYVFKMITKK